MGGKSAHGKTKKHHYYGHPRQINSDGVTHLKRCRLERVRAERIEDIVLRSLKTLISKPGLVEHWLDVYAKSSFAEIPALEGRLTTLNADIEAKSKRIENLVTRISQLPDEIPADPFFGQIKDLNGRIAELKTVQAGLLSQSKALKLRGISKPGLLEKVQSAIQRIESLAIDRRRPIYTNLIKFVELHPTKIRIGVFAPTASTPDENFKATGTDGGGLGGFAGKEGAVLPFAPSNRGGSTSVTNGAP